MKAILTSLMLWLSQNSALPVDTVDALPTVRSQSASVLVAHLLGSDASAAMSDNQRAMLEREVSAVYLPSSQTILLRSDIDPTSTWGRSLLLHELVHHVQIENGMEQDLDCVEALEYRAYSIQRRYLQTFGHQVPFTDSKVALWSRCPSS